MHENIGFIMCENIMCNEFVKSKIDCVKVNQTEIPNSNLISSKVKTRVLKWGLKKPYISRSIDELISISASDLGKWSNKYIAVVGKFIDGETGILVDLCSKNFLSLNILPLTVIPKTNSMVMVQGELVVIDSFIMLKVIDFILLNDVNVPYYNYMLNHMKSYIPLVI